MPIKLNSLEQIAETQEISRQKSNTWTSQVPKITTKNQNVTNFKNYDINLIKKPLTAYAKEKV